MTRLYKTIKHSAQAEITEKKSRFIALMQPVQDRQAAREFIDLCKNKYPDARHHVYAYIIEQEQVYKKYSDDGEPKGTAGLPILDLLEKENLQNICVVVVRYFGGILLGPGGLVRAYMQATAEALKVAEPHSLALHKKFQINLDYTQYQRIRAQLDKHKFYQSDIQYGEEITWEIGVFPEKVQILKDLIAELSAGKIFLTAVEDIWLPLPPLEDPPPDK